MVWAAQLRMAVYWIRGNILQPKSYENPHLILWIKWIQSDLWQRGYKRSAAMLFKNQTNLNYLSLGYASDNYHFSRIFFDKQITTDSAVWNSKAVQ